MNLTGIGGTARTVTYDYTSDGGYTQAAAVGEPLTVADNMGHTSHFRYTARGQVLSVVDALGNETDYGDATPIQSLHQGFEFRAEKDILPLAIPAPEERPQPGLH